MKLAKENISILLMSLAELVIGILLLINPVGFTSGIIIAVGIILICMGLMCVIKYFRMEPAEAAKSANMSMGLFALLVGAFCVLKSDWFVATFPVLTMIYGIGILISGLAKIQWMVDILRLKKQKWYLAAISAICSIGCGIVIISNPFVSTEVLWIFTGVILIVEAVFDVVALIFENMEKKVTEVPVMTDEDVENSFVTDDTVMDDIVTEKEEAAEWEESVLGNEEGTEAEQSAQEQNAEEKTE